MSKTRIVTLFAGAGKSNPQFEVKEPATFADVKKFIRDAGVDIDGGKLRFIVGETETELVTDTSVLPDGDIIIFALQKESKGGAASRTELYSTIKAILAKNPNILGGRNYTQVSNTELQAAIDGYGKKDVKKAVIASNKNAPAKVAPTPKATPKGNTSGKLPTGKPKHGVPNGLAKVEHAINDLQEVGGATTSNEKKLKQAINLLEEVKNNWDINSREVDVDALNNKAASLANRISGISGY